MKKYNKLVLGFVLAFTLVANSFSNVKADEKDVVIVLDPGHGGTQNGAEYNNILEKDINAKVAQVIVEELAKYEGVEVKLTHETAEETMSIKERADYAHKVEADYYFSLHFNASGNHNFYGAEAWVTSFGRYYSEMYAFSEIVLEEFEKLGVYNRGIKTKLETDGTDYYGVLRRCAEYEIPSVIIEHCHMDNAADDGFLDEEEDFIKFGQADATAIAKFLGLKSTELGVDYSGYQINYPEEPVEKIKNDETSPELEVSIKNVNEMLETITFEIKASDTEQPVIYYGYSVDGGETFSPLYPWEAENDVMNIRLSFEECRDKNISLIVYNAYNLATSSPIISAEEINALLPLEEVTASSPIVVETLTGGEIYLGISAGCILLALIVIIVSIKNTRKPSI